MKFFSVLNLRRVTSEFVGTYSCSEKSRKKVLQKFHLYVDDADHPVSDPEKDGEVVKARIGDPALIPCRPSHPGYQGPIKKSRLYHCILTKESPKIDLKLLFFVCYFTFVNSNLFDSWNESS